jgi:hypothetical protein
VAPRDWLVEIAFSIVQTLPVPFEAAHAKIEFRIEYTAAALSTRYVE